MKNLKSWKRKNIGLLFIIRVIETKKTGTSYIIEFIKETLFMGVFVMKNVFHSFSIIFVESIYKRTNIVFIFAFDTYK